MHRAVSGLRPAYGPASYFPDRELHPEQVAYLLVAHAPKGRVLTQYFAVAMGTDLSDGAEDLTLPIRFQNGNMSIGSYPVGPAPLLH